MNFVFRGASSEPPTSTRNNEVYQEGRMWARMLIHAQRWLVPSLHEDLLYAEQELKALTDDEFNLYGLMWFRDNIMPLLHPDTAAKMAEIKEEIK